MNIKFKMNNVFLILGGNLDNRKSNIEKVCLIIGEEIGAIQKKSMMYETEPWGFENENNFINQVILISTELSPTEIHKKIEKIESLFGRKRCKKERYQSRTIDIDILFFNAEIINLPELCIPHPSLHLRNFVLVPMNELDPNFIHPVFNKTINRLLAECRDNKWIKQFLSD